MAWRYRIGKNLQELRFLYCANSVGSQGVRDFIEKQYHSIKSMNPILPIIVRECDGIRAKVIARYGPFMYDYYNNTKEMDLEGLAPPAIEDALKRLTEIGEVMPRSQESDFKRYRPESVI
ncbi:NADH dehydrogenase [Blastocystis sp. subtype 4]|uniref:NADH dehydrogenase n=1 Tax=Blastocystis sp. subtype 4 TaxID=944170 RepID=UPI000712163C|nr:NADH dehydrogenase [Blastocystis sp. subtype 4]KNB41287.1 NADH dehydrogenase [Blastocystis sp. subtype 4]|eukprot:XP_014524730.1 NADH dehydrogenase [Blastocystis sp. subtype 4]